MRPKFHFTPAQGWINDPHGITYRDGKYHSFFQYVPGSTAWAPSCHWGHAVGENLLQISETEIALAPGDGDDGIWTGSLISEGTEARIFFTSVQVPDFGIGKVRMATPADSNWLKWNKGAVVVEAPADLDLIAFRDPFVRREAGGWRMFLGAGDAAGNAMALSYFSTDLEKWSYEGVALQRSNLEQKDVWTGSLWECPQFVSVDNIEIMVSSIWDNHKLFYAAYAQGEYSDGVFTPAKWGRLTYGDSYYAPSYFEDRDGQPCLQFWMREISDAPAGWAGAHSIPYRLTHSEGEIILNPHQDIESFRNPSPSKTTQGLAADVVWMHLNNSLKVISGGIVILEAQSDTSDQIVISLGSAEQRLPSSDVVRIILDGPILEVSTGRAVFGARIDPQGENFVVECRDESRVEVFSLMPNLG